MSLTACGDGGTGPVDRDGFTRIELESDPGDYIGQGESYTYTQADSRILVNQVGAAISVSVTGNEEWNGSFRPRQSAERPAVGLFEDAVLQWEGDHRTCSTTSGWFAVDDVTFSNGSMTEVSLRFEQFCGGDDSGPALRGDVRWSAFDETVPPGPVDPPPEGLWRPAPGATPESGTFVYLSSEPGDYVGQGEEYLHAIPADSFDVEARGGFFAIQVEGTSSWSGTFQVMNVIDRIRPGYYPGLQRWAFSNPYKGGFSWTGNGRGCNESMSWVVVDDVVFDGDDVSAIALRFEQLCDGNPAALRGAVRWSR